MRLKEVLARHRNDFHWLGECESCGKTQRYGDGYADHFYCTKVVPGRHCPECGLNSYGMTAAQVDEDRKIREATQATS